MTEKIKNRHLPFRNIVNVSPITNQMNSFETHFLYPSALFASKKPHFVSTILGSCVSVCLYDPILQFGGINHYMLPLWNGDGLVSPKFGNIAIQRLLKKMQELGSDRNNLQAKVFGGSDVIDYKHNLFNIGTRNIEIAREVLREEKIPVIALSVGGQLGRKIIFNTHTGEVIQKFIEKTNYTQGEVINRQVK